MTRSTGVMPADNCDEWVQRVHEWAQGDTEMVEWLAMLAADCAFGRSDTDMLALVAGPTRSGKTTFVESISRALGGYTAAVEADHLASGQKHKPHAAWLAALDGARMVTASEPERGTTWDSSLVKRLTGSDTVSANFMRGNTFSFVPAFRLVMSCNDKPMLPDGMNDTDALMTRIKVVPFEEGRGRNVDESVRYKFARSAEGASQVLRWIIDASARFHQRPPTDRYPKCRRIEAATAAYYATKRPIAEWFDAQVEQAFGEMFGVDEAYQDMKSWGLRTKNTTCTTMNLDAFRRELRVFMAPHSPQRPTVDGVKRPSSYLGYHLKPLAIRLVGGKSKT